MNTYHMQRAPFLGQNEYAESAVPRLENGDFSPEPVAGPLSGRHHHAERASEPRDEDKKWAIAFKINVLLTVISAVCFGSLAAKLLAEDVLSAAGRRSLLQSRIFSACSGDSSSSDFDDECQGVSLSGMVGRGIVMLALAAAVSVGMLHSFVACGKGILFASYALFASIFGFLGVIATAKGHHLVAAVLALVCFLIMSFTYTRRHRIQFGAANLQVASLAIKAMPWTFRSAILMSVLQLFWCIVAGIAAFGSFIVLETVTVPDGTSYRAIYCLDNVSVGHVDNTFTSSCTCNGEKVDGDCEYSGLGLPLMIGWLLSLGWGCTVIKNVVAATVTGSVASWWFSPHEDSTPVKGAFHRATHTSFGCLCKAAVLQNAMRALHHVARRVLRFVPCATFLLCLVEKAVDYILSYTICFVAIYGLTFKEAGKRIRELFEKRAVTVIANDVIVDIGLTVAAISAAFMYAMASGWLWRWSMYNNDDIQKFVDMSSVQFWSLFGPQIFGAISCAFLVATLVEVLRSAFKAIFVCFVQDPQALGRNHDPKLLEGLSTAWRKMRGECVSSGVVPAILSHDQVQMNHSV